ncbi:MAG: hypothetical protein LW716_19040 [Microcystis sp. 53602_E8]|nr:hypothetical protein [Microcystis sp. 53602_E8]
MPDKDLAYLCPLIEPYQVTKNRDYFYLFFPHPTPYTLHPTPYTPHPTPYTLHPTPHTPHPTPHTPHPISDN